MLAAKFLLRLYLRYFTLILLGLVIFFVSLEFLQALKSLPSAANLQVLYLWYKGLYALDVVMPITVVFAMIATKLHLIRSNELVAFYALGYSKKDLIRPIFGVAFFLTLIYLVLHSTSFTYADEYAKNIKKYRSIASATNDLFFRFDQDYVFFKRLYPLQKKAEGVRVFEVLGKDIKRMVFAKEGYFRNGSWLFPKAKIVLKKGTKIEKEIKDLRLLQGFKPKILDSIYEGKTNLSLPDVLYALSLLAKQGADTAKLRSILYAHLFFPFFAPLLVVIIFYFVPVTARLANVNLFVFGAVLVSLIVWGVYYLLLKLTFSGVLEAETGILLPIFLLSLIAFYFYKRF